MYRSAALDMGSSQGETILGRFAGSGRKSGSMTSAQKGRPLRGIGSVSQGAGRVSTA